MNSICKFDSTNGFTSKIYRSVELIPIFNNKFKLISTNGVNNVLTQEKSFLTLEDIKDFAMPKNTNSLKGRVQFYSGEYKEIKAINTFNGSLTLSDDTIVFPKQLSFYSSLGRNDDYGNPIYEYNTLINFSGNTLCVYQDINSSEYDQFKKYGFCNFRTNDEYTDHFSLVGRVYKGKTTMGSYPWTSNNLGIGSIPTTNNELFPGVIIFNTEEYFSNVPDDVEISDSSLESFFKRYKKRNGSSLYDELSTVLYSKDQQNIDRILQEIQNNNQWNVGLHLYNNDITKKKYAAADDILIEYGYNGNGISTNTPLIFVFSLEKQTNIIKKIIIDVPIETRALTTSEKDFNIISKNASAVIDLKEYYNGYNKKFCDLKSFRRNISSSWGTPIYEQGENQAGGFSFKGTNLETRLIARGGGNNIFLKENLLYKCYDLNFNTNDKFCFILNVLYRVKNDEIQEKVSNEKGFIFLQMSGNKVETSWMENNKKHFNYHRGLSNVQLLEGNTYEIMPEYFEYDQFLMKTTIEITKNSNNEKTIATFEKPLKFTAGGYSGKSGDAALLFIDFKKLSEDKNIYSFYFFREKTKIENGVSHISIVSNKSVDLKTSSIEDDEKIIIYGNDSVELCKFLSKKERPSVITGNIKYDTDYCSQNDKSDIIIYSPEISLCGDILKGEDPKTSSITYYNYFNESASNLSFSNNKSLSSFGVSMTSSISTFLNTIKNKGYSYEIKQRLNYLSELGGTGIFDGIQLNNVNFYDGQNFPSPDQFITLEEKKILPDSFIGTDGDDYKFSVYSSLYYSAAMGYPRNIGNPSNIPLSYCPAYEKNKDSSLENADKYFKSYTIPYGSGEMVYSDTADEQSNFRSVDPRSSEGEFKSALLFFEEKYL